MTNDLSLAPKLNKTTRAKARLKADWEAGMHEAILEKANELAVRFETVQRAVDTYSNTTTPLSPTEIVDRAVKAKRGTARPEDCECPPTCDPCKLAGYRNPPATVDRRWGLEPYQRA